MGILDRLQYMSLVCPTKARSNYRACARVSERGGEESVMPLGSKHRVAVVNAIRCSLRLDPQYIFYFDIVQVIMMTSLVFTNLHEMK